MSLTRKVELLKALADETRLSIVQKIARDGGEAASCDICACKTVTALSQPAMSHHFSKLVDAGILLEHKRGVQKTYTLNNELLVANGITITD